MGRTTADLSKTQVPEFREKLNEAILKEMKRQGLSQGAVGRIIGMDRRNVNKTLRGPQGGISLSQLIRIANGIGLNINLIIKRKK